MPRQIHVSEEFPRGPAGKVILRELQEQIAKTKDVEIDHTGEGSLTDQIINLAAHSFKCPAEELNMESTAETTRGWNSLAHVEFLLNLEKEFEIKIEPRDIMSVRSIGDAMNIVETKTSKVA